MTNSFPVRVMLCCIPLLVGAFSCGCATMKGTQEKWAASWKEKSKPRINDPKDEEVVRYWGQKKPEKNVEMSPELKARIDAKTEELKKARAYADNFREGNQKLKANQLDEARRLYELALEAKPGDPDIHHRLAVVADKQRMFGEADDHYEEAMRQRPRDANLLSDFGYSQSLRGDDARAERTLLSALAIDPMHKGAMANLGAIYSKQGRYDEAFTVFRRGATEAEAQQYMAQLFPQGPPSGSRSGDRMLADGKSSAADPRRNAIEIGPGQRDGSSRNNDSRDSSTSRPENRSDLSSMTVDQLMAEMDKRRAMSQASRSDGSSPPSQPWAAGPAGNQVSQNSNGLTHQNNPVNSGTNSGSAAGSMTVPLGQVQLQPSTGNPLRAAPGTNPLDNLDAWKGASGQPAPAGNSSIVQQTPFVGSGAQPPVGMNPNPMANWNGSGAQPQVEQVGYTETASINEAAAQMAMAVGPGGLFPIVRGSGSSTNGGTPSNAQGAGFPGSFRMGSDYPQAPTQLPPNTNSGMPTPRPGSQLPGFNPPSFQPMPSNNGTGASGSGISLPNFQPFQPAAATGNAPTSQTNDLQIAPRSPAEGMVQPWEAPPNLHNWNGPNQSSPSAGTNPNASGMNSGLDSGNSAPSRFARAPWEQPSASSPNPVQNAAPYSGSWPNANSSTGAATPTNGAAPSSLPAWNGGVDSGSSWSSSTSAGASSSSTPAPWPYAPRR